MNSTDTRLSLAQFIDKHGLTMECQRINSRPDGLMGDDAMARHFLCTLTRKERKMVVYFTQGSGHKQSPTLKDVLDCIAMDASGFESATSFEDWAGDYGYDTDSRKAERIYDACRAQSVQLRGLMGEAYEELLWNTERL